MKLERIAPNQIKYSISFDELSGKGFINDELLRNSFIWDDLFDEMLEEANNLYALETDGAVSIEIFSLTAKELVLIMTLDEHELEENNTCELTSLSHQQDTVLHFQSIDDCILLAKALARVPLEICRSSLYSHNSLYYLVFKQAANDGGFFCLCEEYGQRSSLTAAVLQEYGHLIIEEDALQRLDAYFT